MVRVIHSLDIPAVRPQSESCRVTRPAAYRQQQFQAGHAGTAEAQIAKTIDATGWSAMGDDDRNRRADQPPVDLIS